MGTFLQDIRGSMAVSIHRRPGRRTIQTAINAFTAEREVLRIIGIVGGHQIPVQETRLGCVGFFLFHVKNPIPFAKCLDLATKRPLGNLHKVWGVPPSEVDRVRPTGIHTDHNRTDFVIQTVIDCYRRCSESTAIS